MGWKNSNYNVILKLLGHDQKDGNIPLYQSDK